MIDQKLSCVGARKGSKSPLSDTFVGVPDVSGHSACWTIVQRAARWQGKGRGPLLASPE